MHMPSDFETQLRSQGYQEVAAISRDAGYALGEHSHPFDACALIVSGDITLTVAGVASTYAVGSVFELPRNTPHHEHAGAQGVSYIAGRRT